MKFLVTGANGDIGEAIGRILKERYPDATIDGADCSGILPAACLFDTVHLLPVAKSPDFPKSFGALASAYDWVIPVPEAELLVLASQPQSWRKSLKLVMNEPWVISTFCDKLKTSEWLEQCGDISVRTIPLSAATPDDLPIVAKPRFGWGSKGVQIVRSPDQLKLLRNESNDSWIAQTFLDADDQEYTCAIIKADAVVNTLVMRRSLQGGLTKLAKIVWHDKINAGLIAIAEKLPARAFVNVQLRVVNEKAQIFEINPRFSSTVMMRHLVGFHDLHWAILSYEGTTMKPTRIAPGRTVVRLSREVVFDQ